MNQFSKLLINLIFLSSLSILALGQKTKEIIILHSDIVGVNEILFPNIQILKGGVILKHDSAVMYCDSAYFNSKDKSFRAFGEIYIQSPTENLRDTVELWGDSLNYSGTEKIARVRSNVILKKDSMTLYTNNLDYNISEDIGKYIKGGRTINGEDTLISEQGYYYANEDELFFKEKVKIYNPKYSMFCDTLKHNTKKKISYILGPTNIISTDTTSSFIYCENGWYNHNKDLAQFNKNALLVNGKQTLKGDSLFYDRKKRIGKAYNNVTAVDSTQNSILKGDHGEYEELTERSLMTKKALFIQVQKGDSLFLHADTLLSQKDTIMTKSDTSIYTVIKAYHKVKLYKSDFQAKCDSLIYSMLDSTIELHNRPVLWSGKNQITAKLVKILNKNDEISKVYMNLNALIVSESDTSHFDQIRGKNMVAFLDDNKLKKIDVLEDGELIYFGRDKDEIVGVNKLTCMNMSIYLTKNEVDTIWFYQNPEGTLYPPDYLKADELKFDNFQWNDIHRPKSKEDVFIWKEDKTIEPNVSKKKIDINSKNKMNEKFKKPGDSKNLKKLDQKPRKN